MINFSLSDLVDYIEDQIPSIVDVVAHDGLIILKRILDNADFSHSNLLNNYEIYSEASSDSVSFTIELDETALTDESKRKMRKETSNTFRRNARDVQSRGEAREFRSVYMMGPNGRPERILGRRDARKPRKDARRFVKDARKNSVDRGRADFPRNSGERYVDHELSATAPRGMEVEDGKLRITMQREIRNTSKKVIFPKGMYQGIIKQFIDELVDVMENEFSSKLEQLIQGK